MRNVCKRPHCGRQTPSPTELPHTTRCSREPSLAPSIAMTFPDQFDILAYISPNPSPMHWVISGDESDVREIVQQVLALDGASLLAMAHDSGYFFARFELSPELPYRTIGGLIFEAQRRRLAMGAPQPLVGTISSGLCEELGNPHAVQPVVGLLGSSTALEGVKAHLPWAVFFDFWLSDGREGQGFRPTLQNEESYRHFVEAVVSGGFSGLDVVLLSKPVG